jgi:hypothetical protein
LAQPDNSDQQVIKDNKVNTVKMAQQVLMDVKAQKDQSEHMV